MHGSPERWICVVWLALWTGAGAAATGDFRIVAYAGLAAPGGGATFANSLTLATDTREIDANGRVAFGAFLDLAGGGTASGLFTWEDGLTEQLLRTGDPAPGGGLFDVVSLAGIVQNDAGGVFFEATLSGTSVGRGLFLHDGVDTVALLRDGDALPGTGAVWTGGGRGAVPNAAGAVLLALSFDDTPAADAGLFLWNGGGLIKVARTGDPVPANSTIGNPTYAELGFADRFDFNDPGEVAFVANRTVYRGLPGAIAQVLPLFAEPKGLALLDDGTLIFAKSTAIYRQAGAGAMVEVLVDNTTPAPRPGETFLVIDRVTAVEADAVAFRGTVFGGDGLRSGIYLWKGGAVAEVFAPTEAEKDAAPEGAPIGFDDFAAGPSGTVVFEANLKLSPAAGLFVSDGDALTQLAVGAPGTAFGRPSLVVGRSVATTGAILLEADGHPVPGGGNANALLVYRPGAATGREAVPLPPWSLTATVIGIAGLAIRVADRHRLARHR